MSELVLIHHNEPMTTSLAIAEGTENTHQAILKMVKTYVAQLQEFGEVGFQIRLNPQGSPTEFAFLNEQQATLLITFLRNSDIVVRFKVALVKAFYELRDRQPATPTFQTSNLSHGADLAVAADRTFRGFLRASRAAGLALPAALRVANRQTLARTGMDMLAEIDLDPATIPESPPPQTGRGPAAHLPPVARQDPRIGDFWLDWVGELIPGLPCIPCRSLDLHQAYNAWARQNDILYPAALHHLIAYIRRQPGVRVVQERYATHRGIDKHTIITPPAHRETEDQHRAAWLGENAARFRAALETFAAPRKATP